MHHEPTSGARSGRRLSIGAKLYGAFGAAIGLLLAVGILSIHSLGQRQRRGPHDVQRRGPRASVSSASVDASLADGQRLMLRGVLEIGDAAAQREVDAELATVTADVDKALAAETAIEQSPQEEALVSRFQADLARYRQARSEVRRLSRAGQRAAALKAYDDRQQPLRRRRRLPARPREAERAGGARPRPADLVDLLELAAPGARAPGHRDPRRRRGRVPGDPRVRRGVQRMVATLRSLQDECISTLRGAMQAMAGGDLTRTVHADVPPIDRLSNDEIGDAGEAVNEIRESTLGAIDSYTSMREQLVTLSARSRRAPRWSRPPARRWPRPPRKPDAPSARSPTP